MKMIENRLHIYDQTGIQREGQRQSKLESWLLEHVGLVLMGPCTLNDRLLWLLSVGIALSGFPRKLLRWNRYRPNWGFTITYTACSMHACEFHIALQNAWEAKTFRQRWLTDRWISNTCFINHNELYVWGLLVTSCTANKATNPGSGNVFHTKRIISVVPVLGPLKVEHFYLDFQYFQYFCVSKL